MILLDTCVLSEPLKPVPDRRVLAWLDNQVAETLCTTAVTLAELLSGVARLPDGHRKRGLAADAQKTVQALFNERIFPFDAEAAAEYARIEELARKAGHPLSVVDQQIAAIAKAHKYTIASRDVDPFRAAGLTVLNPWD